MAINLVFIFSMLVNNKLYAPYDAGYKIANYLHGFPVLNVVDYQVNLSSLEFNTSNSYSRVENESLLPRNEPYYLVINEKQWSLLSLKESTIILKSFLFIRQDRFIPTIFNHTKRESSIDKILLVNVVPNINSST